MKKLSILIVLIFISFKLNAQDYPEVVNKLISIADVTVKEIPSRDSLWKAYEVMLLQPLDHLNPYNGKQFKQRIFWFHRNSEVPTTMVTEGYSAGPYMYETTYLTGGNQISVEHRYFGASVPDSLDWHYLTTAQAAADHHRIYEIFHKIYPGKWISTGISKGGQTTIFYKYYYPNDMNVWLPYVAPLNFEQEDSRIHTFLNSVGSKEYRDRILNFQRAVLSQRDEIIPLLKKHAEEKQYTFPISIDSVFEYSVFEYSFSFWQWGNVSCGDIPDAGSSPEKLFNHLVKASSYDYFDSRSMKFFAPFFYQAYTEIGYYNYDTKPFKDLLKAVKTDAASNIIFSPMPENSEFNSQLMNNISNYLLTDGNNMLYIYGGLDTWSSTSVDIGNKTNALKMVLVDGHHQTRINSFKGEDKEKIYKTLSEWLDWEIK